MTRALNDGYPSGTDPKQDWLENWSSLGRQAESGASERRKSSGVSKMRVMEIPPFPRKFENRDLENL